tara:strand:+ start:762 stop:884 length:123 start_codon:yes stop_codon:yes gene_type:complete
MKKNIDIIIIVILALAIIIGFMVKKEKSNRKETYIGEIAP